MTDFATELEQLICKHLGAPQWSEDYLKITNVLEEALSRLNIEAERLPSKEDVESEE